MLSIAESPARARLFYGMYDYPVIDYYFETIRRDLASSRGFVLRDGIFPFVEGEYRESRVGRHIFHVAEHISSVRFRSLIGRLHSRSRIFGLRQFAYLTACQNGTFMAG